MPKPSRRREATRWREREIGAAVGDCAWHSSRERFWPVPFPRHALLPSPTLILVILRRPLALSRSAALSHQGCPPPAPCLAAHALPPGLLHPTPKEATRYLPPIQATRPTPPVRAALQHWHYHLILGHSDRCLSLHINLKPIKGSTKASIIPAILVFGGIVAYWIPTYRTTRRRRGDATDFCFNWRNLAACFPLTCCIAFLIDLLPSPVGSVPRPISKSKEALPARIDSAYVFGLLTAYRRGTCEQPRKQKMQVYSSQQFYQKRGPESLEMIHNRYKANLGYKFSLLSSVTINGQEGR